MMHFSYDLKSLKYLCVHPLELLQRDGHLSTRAQQGGIVKVGMDGYGSHPCWSILVPDPDCRNPVPKERAVEVVGEKSLFTFPRLKASRYRDFLEIRPVLVWVVNLDHQILVRGWGIVELVIIYDKPIVVQDGADPHPQPKAAADSIHH